MTSAEVDQWPREYDDSGIHLGRCDMAGHVWPRCIASDSPRALKTAQAIHTGEIVATPKLREPVLGSLWDGSTVRLPYGGWKLLPRLVGPKFTSLARMAGLCVDIGVARPCSRGSNRVREHLVGACQPRTQGEQRVASGGASIGQIQTVSP